MVRKVTFTAAAAAAAAAILLASSATTISVHAQEYEWGYEGGYEGFYEDYEYAGPPTKKPTKPTKSPTMKPTKKPTMQPTMKPVATAAPTMPFNTDSTCVTSGGFVPEGSACLPTWTYQKNSNSKKITMRGCMPITKATTPFQNAKQIPATPSDPGFVGSFCATSKSYVAKGGSKKNWGYCGCEQRGCLVPTVEALEKQAVKLLDQLPYAGKEKFRSIVTPVVQDWAMLLDVDHGKEERCDTDGGFAATGTPCLDSWTYVGKKGVTTELSGCVDVSGPYSPFTNKNAKNPSLTNTSKLRWCATSATYDPSKNAQKQNWGYCNCLKTSVVAGVNAVLASYNGLTLPDRQSLMTNYVMVP